MSQQAGTGRGAVFSVFVAPLVGLMACDPPPPLLPQPPNASAYWVERSDAELEAVLAETCARAVQASKPVLLAFSAPWCIDCRQLRALEAQPVVHQELAHWEQVVVHVGRFDRHSRLREAFGVGAIAHWTALRPTECAADVTRWPVLEESVFEPQTGWFGVKTADGVAEWLADARGR